MSKKELMAKASQDRLDKIESMASKYADHAARFAEADISPDADLRSLKDDQLPLMASPQQMEDLFRTAHVVKKLSDNCSDFEDKAKQIAAGLQAAMDMMQKAGELMERMVKKMFPKPGDSEDLLEAIHQLIQLGYDTQQALADLSKQEALASKDKQAEAKCKELKEKVENCKSETLNIQGSLRGILASKREVVEKMRITKGEKEYFHSQLRMITMMTIQSLQSQSS
jgi:signal transduction histidine kinase